MPVLFAFWAALVLLLPVSSFADDTVRVLLMQDAQRAEVSAERGVTVQMPNGETRVFAGSFVARPSAGGLTLNGELIAAGSVTIRSRGGDLAVTNGGYGTGESKPLSVGGSLKILVRGNGLLLVNDVDLEEYIKGVVPAEMSPGWHPEALKAQAVVARTYALYQRMLNKSREYDLAATVQDQVYQGRHGVDQRVQEAVESTRGIAVAYQSAPIYAAFSSTAAGPTEDAMNVWSKDLPYLKGVDCPFDVNAPRYQWRAVLKMQDLEATFRRQGVDVGAIASLTPFAYSKAGRVTKLRILHSRGELILRGEDFRRLIGYSVIPSTQFDVESMGWEIAFSGRGAGHAVGLCQWGAKEMAEHGYPYTTILAYYFPGTELRRTSSLSR
ncbi:MAG TPA: SpoIID/LytB domain-containing protein [Nitrospiraceae bacterium]|nr:SpoIID/LytB domain-containing protein [Nitrospiraceae bacterium]